MQQDLGKLTIHTKFRPGSVREAKESREKGARFRPRRLRMGNKLTRGERLLRNTAICCALMMGLMALKNIDKPWSQEVSQTVSKAVTMRLDLDETLGRLNFVKNLMPDTALVFWNMGSSGSLASPVSGTLTHAYSTGQPWQEYQVSGEHPVYAAEKGVIAVVSENDRGEWTVLIDHEEGRQSVYAYLGKVIVASGQDVQKGQQIAVTRNEDASRVYFELRKNGAAIDPGKA